VKGIPSPSASPIRPRAVAATGNGRRAPETGRRCRAAGNASHALGLRAAPVRGRGGRDGPRRVAGWPVVQRGRECGRPARAAHRAGYGSHSSAPGARAWSSLRATCALAAHESPGLEQRPSPVASAIRTLAGAVTDNGRRARERTAGIGLRDAPAIVLGLAVTRRSNAFESICETFNFRTPDVSSRSKISPQHVRSPSEFVIAMITELRLSHEAIRPRKGFC